MRSFVLRSDELRKHVIAWLSALDLSEPMEVVVRPYKAKRNSEQNRLMWAILNEIAENTPWDADCWHEHFKRTYIGIEKIPMPDGSAMERGMSTTKLNVSEFADYVTKIQRYATQELGIRLAA